MITVKSLTMRLAAGDHTVTVLDDVTVEIPEKQIVAIAGPSGSGKSTLLGLIAGLDRPTAGSIRLDGLEITTLAESEMARFRRKNIGYIFARENSLGSQRKEMKHLWAERGHHCIVYFIT